MHLIYLKNIDLDTLMSLFTYSLHLLDQSIEIFLKKKNMFDVSHHNRLISKDGKEKKIHISNHSRLYFDVKIVQFFHIVL